MSDISFSILGRPFYGQHIPDSIKRWLKKNWHFPEHSLPEVPYVITLKVLDAAPALGKGVRRKSEANINDEVFWWRKDANRWWFQEGNAGLQFVLGTDNFNISVWGLHNASQTQINRILIVLNLAFLEAIRASGLFPLHASVAIKDGSVTAYTGESGMGKSTTLVKAMAEHAEPLAEDISLLDPQTAMIYGWDHGLRFWEDGWQKLPQKFKEMDWQTAADGKMFLPWEKTTMERTVSSRLDQVFVLERASARKATPVKQQILPHQAVRALWEARGVPLTEYTKRKVSKGIGKLISDIEVADLYI